MSSKQCFWLSTLFLFATTLLIVIGSCVALTHFFPHVRFAVAEHFNEGRLSVLLGGFSVLVTGLIFFAAFLWLSREKFIQIKLAGGVVGLGKSLIEKTVGDFWLEHFGAVPVVAIDHEHQIEVFYQAMEDAQLAMVQKELPLHLLHKLGAQPSVVLNLAGELVSST